MSVQEWRDLEYLELNPEIMKIRALLMLKNKRGQLTFGDLKEIMCAAEFNEHKLCVVCHFYIEVKKVQNLSESDNF